MPRINSGSAEVNQTPAISGAGTAPYYVSNLTNNYSVLTPLFADETAKKEQNQLFHLVTLQIPDDNNTTLYLVDSNYDITFDGVVYTRFPLKFTGANVNSDGTVDKTSITVANVDRSLMYYVEGYDGLRGSRVKVKSVYKNALDDLYSLNTQGVYVSTGTNTTGNPGAYIEDEYIIDSYSATEQVIVFQLDPIIDLQIMVPRRRYMVDTCYWPYRDSGLCKYAVTYLSTGTNVITLGGSAINVDTPAVLASFVVAGLDFGISSSNTTAYSILSVSTTDHTITVLGTVPSTSGVYAPLYFNTHATCDMTFAACRARNNEENFGGFPGISGTRRLYL